MQIFACEYLLVNEYSPVGEYVKLIFAPKRIIASTFIVLHQIEYGMRISANIL
jgi:hypothetical protein